VFNRILLPIDGSEQSLQAASTGIAVAAASGAKVIALEVLKPLASVVLAADAILHDSSSHTARAIRRAREDLAEVRLMADEAGVVFEDGYAFDHRPYLAILAAAERADVDLIVVSGSQYASRHHDHLSGEITRLVGNAGVPVLVCP